MPRARLPVDPAAVHARLVFAERLELGAFAADATGDEAELGVAQEGLERGRADRREVGPDADLVAEPAMSLAVSEPERSAPAQPQFVQRAGAAAIGNDIGLAVPHFRKLSAFEPRLRGAAFAEPRIETQRRLGRAVHRPREFRMEHEAGGLAHLDVRRIVQLEIDQPAGEYPIERRHDHQRQRRRRSDDPRLRRQGRDHHSHRCEERQQQQRAG